MALCQRLERIAHYDPLTMLPNRVLLADRMNQAMTQTQRRGQQQSSRSGCGPGDRMRPGPASSGQG